MALIKRLLCFFVLDAQACLLSTTSPSTISDDRLPSLQTCTHETNYGFKSSNGSKIVGGVYAKENDWPFLVRLEIKTRDGTGLCGGTIIDNRWVLSAGHCCEDALRIKATFSDLQNFISDSGEYTIKAVRWLQQPGFNLENLDNDLCLIKFDEDVIAADRDDDVQMACLTDIIPETGSKCWIAGWGTTSSGGSLSVNLKSAQVDIMDLDYCKRKSDYPSYWFGPEMICAGKLDYDWDGEADGGVDACQGDSGGPLICDVDGNAALVGVVSWGVGCAREGYPGVYSSPAYWRSFKWVRETVEPLLTTTTTTTTTKNDVTTTKTPTTNNAERLGMIKTGLHSFALTFAVIFLA